MSFMIQSVFVSRTLWNVSAFNMRIMFCRWNERNNHKFSLIVSLVCVLRLWLSHTPSLYLCMSKSQKNQRKIIISVNFYCFFWWNRRKRREKYHKKSLLRWNRQIGPAEPSIWHFSTIQITKQEKEKIPEKQTWELSTIESE